MKRIAYIDIMKGIAIVAVIVGHYQGFQLPGTIIWSFHMPLFIFISGYFFKQRKLTDLLKRNFKHYLIPYFLVWMGILTAETLIYSVYNHISSEGTPILEVVIQRLISGIYSLASNSVANKPEFVVKIGVIWFLNALFIGELLLFFTLEIKRHVGQIITILLVLIAASCQTAFFCIPFGINYGCAFLPWLYIGYVFKQRDIFAYIDKKALKIIIPVIWGGVIAAEQTGNNSFNIIYLRFPLYGLEYIGALCGILCVRWLSIGIENHSKKLNALFCRLGRNTIWILCVHAMDIELWNYVSGFVPIEKNVMGLIRLMLDLLVAFAIKSCWEYIKTRKTGSALR